MVDVPDLQFWQANSGITAMRIARKTEIAIGILLSCTESEVIRTGHAAANANASKWLAAHTVLALVRGGFLVTFSGRCGGLRLARPASTIGVGEAVRFIQDRRPPQKTNPNSALEELVWAARESFFARFDHVSLADLRKINSKPPYSSSHKSLSAFR